MFQRGKLTMSIPDITIDNQPIDKVEKTKFLGVVIDSKLSWKNHICLVAGKLSKKYWHDHQGKGILEQKCFSNSLLLLCVSLFNILQPCLELHVLHQS